jgi:hypothetical protein
MLVYLWLIVAIPAFVVFRYWAFKWAEEDLETVTNNDKLGL